MATQANLDAVQKLYIAYLGRAADQAGLNFWANAIESGVSTIESVATGFTLTAEYESIYGNLSNEALVEEIYQNTFGRASDADGKAFWVSQLASGAVTADTIALTMSNISGAADKALVDQKVTASNSYTQTAGANYDVTAGKAVLTDINTGGGTPTPTPTPTPTVNVINSTAGADTPTLTAGADQFVTEFGQAAVAQVDTLTLTDFEAGDTLTIEGVADAPVIVTVVDPTKVAEEIVAAVTAASGKTVTAAVSGANVTLTANVSGTPFVTKVTATNEAEGANPNSNPAIANTTPNEVGVDAGADTQMASVAKTTPGTVAADEGSDQSQAADLSNTTPNKEAVAAGLDESQDVSVTHTTSSAPAVPQVDTIALIGDYEIGDTVSVTGLTASAIVVTVKDITKVAEEIVAAVNAAAGTTVTAAVSGTDVTLTAVVADTPFSVDVEAANKAEVVAVAQVDTIAIGGAYEVGDTVSISGVADATILITITDSTKVADEIAAAVNGATGKTVSAAVSGSNVTLTGNANGAPFSATVNASNKAAVTGVAQVETITLTSFEAGDTLTISDVSTAPVTVTVSDPATLANDIVIAINEASGNTVTAAIDGTGKVTLTGDANGTPFDAGFTTTNKAAVPAVAQVDTITLSGTYDIGDTVSITGVSTQPIIVTVADPTNVANEIVAAVTGATGKTVNAAAVSSTELTLTSSTSGTPFTAAVTAANKAAGANTQQASVDTTIVNKVAVESLSTVSNLDTLANFTVGTDKIHFTNLGVDLTAPTELTRVADIATSTDLATDLATAFNTFVGAGEAGLVKVGSDVYLFANDGDAAFSATQDVVIKLTGVALAEQALGTSVVNAAEYFV